VKNGNERSGRNCSFEVVPQDDKVDVLGCMIGFLDAWDDALSYSGLTFMNFGLRSWLASCRSMANRFGQDTRIVFYALFSGSMLLPL